MSRTIVMNIQAPGSEGKVTIEHVTEDQYKFLQLVVDEWNNANQNHSQPYMQLWRIHEAGNAK